MDVEIKGRMVRHRLLAFSDRGLKAALVEMARRGIPPDEYAVLDLGTATAVYFLAPGEATP